MFFFNFLTGTNIKIVTRKIAFAHYRNHGDYKSTKNELITIIKKRLYKLPGDKRSSAQLSMLKIKNYVDLACVYLYVFAPYYYSSWDDATEQLHADFSWNLRDKGIHEIYISGSN